MSSARRTCAHCRQEDDRDALVRLVVVPGGSDVVIDGRGNLPGRGAWVHPQRSCVDGLQTNPSELSRALETPADCGGLLEKLRATVLRGVHDGLSQAAAAGAAVGGHDVLVEALREGRVDMVVVAVDASARTLGDLREAAPAGVPFVAVPLDRGTLGDRVGRGSRAAIGIAHSRATDHLRRQLHRWVALG